MKKVLLTLVCACALTLGSVFAAQAETSGVYVAPKFMMMWQNSNTDMSAPIPGAGTIQAEMNKNQFALGGALAVGYDFFPQFKLPVRAELEFAMRGENKYSDSENLAGVIDVDLETKFSASTLLANFFWDFHNDSDFTPYVTAGAGLAFINAKNRMTLNVGTASRDAIDNSKQVTNFAWNIGAGVAYNFTENLAVDLGYRYLNMGTVSMSDSVNGVNSETDAYLYNHEVMLGIRYTF